MNDSLRLAPLSYYREIRDYLKEREPELWKWFASARAKESYAEALRLALLKSTYRLGAAEHPEWYEHVSLALRQLSLDVPVTLYQAQTSSEPNANIYCLPNEAHIVLAGPLTTLLNPQELTSVFAHELAHFHLWQAEGEEFLVADRLLEAVATDRRTRSPHLETARRYQLYTEIFADRGAVQVTGNLPATVSALAKIYTGVSTVSGESYLAQAAEIFSKSSVKSAGQSHPECFIRAHALALWTEQGAAADAAIRNMIEGQPDLDELDLASQIKTTNLSRRLLGQLLRPRWFRSETAMAHARLYFPDFTPAETEDVDLVDALKAAGPLLKDYFSYVLLDFAHVDRELDDLPLAATLQWADSLEIATHFEKLATKELGVKARDLAKLKPRIAELLAAAERSA